MSSSMKAYLAAKYMSGPKADAILSRTNDGAPKKKKRKTTHASSSTSASFIKDDDLAGWDAVPKEPEEDDSKDAVVASDRGFKKKQRAEEDSGWATVREGEKNEEEEEPADERPQVVDEDKPFRGGLMSAEQLRKTFQKNAHAPELTQEEIAAAQETVYRDATGRKVDIAAERAEAARRKREKEEKEAKKMEWGKGLVQREEVEKRKKEQDALKGKGFARTVDDVEMNEDLKAEERWNDPAAAFLTKKRGKGPRKPEYSGPPPPPNRFGIKPGYRWDGVDRGNGFEKKLFQRINDRKRRTAESYEWSVDDM
ncbi:hypothetical protein QCA50_016716 [Cerrena zonata]|uniref:Pre-mRNA-splicing factor CWC26 n=1 Tax=Cerrena zonata TaxID=2478898 RepID=A0AAW0FLL7_9APHY